MAGPQRSWLTRKLCCFNTHLYSSFQSFQQHRSSTAEMQALQQRQSALRGVQQRWGVFRWIRVNIDLVSATSPLMKCFAVEH